MDCLVSIAFVSADESYGPMVRPEITDAGKTKPFIDLVNMRHPAVERLYKKISEKGKTKEFVPNNCKMGLKKPD